MYIRILLLLVVVSCAHGFSDEFTKTIDFIVNEVNPDKISAYLRNLTLKPHMGGTEAEHDTARMVAEEWKRQGLDEVHMPAYDVLLSYPDYDHPNYARIHDDKGDVVWKSQGRSPGIHAPEESLPEVPPDFNAYSPPGNVTGQVVYVNFGRKEDYHKMTELGIDIQGKIVIARYGELFRANIVSFAEEGGAIAVLLYSDPQQFAQDGVDAVYADTVYLPGNAAALGTVYLEDGDPTTPFYPSIESAFRIPEEEAPIPKIPVMPLCYNDAQEILQRMSGAYVPEEWQGGLNFTYQLGPGLQESGWNVSMEVNTHNQRATTYNVIGVIRGSIEPDRYVVLGNHRDAWIFGAVDPSSGTSVMLELTRTLTEYMKQTDWRPRRSIIFASWGSEEYGLIGSTEWTQQFAKQLGDRAIAYLNVDMAIEGNHTLRTLCAPLLYRAAQDVTKMIPNPNPEEVAKGRTTVFDTWLFNSPSEEDPTRPIMQSIGSGSDYRMFQHTLGIPSSDYAYTHSKDMYTEPLYHTLYETYFMVSELFDIGFHYHASIVQSWGAMATYLADSEILPYDVIDYANYIVASQLEFQELFQEILDSQNLTLDFFLEAGLDFMTATKAFTKELEQNPPVEQLAVRRVNDQLMMVERAFLDPQGLPGRPAYNHVVMAPSASNAYAGSSFSGLSDVWEDFDQLSSEERAVRVRTFEQHLAACTHALLVACKVLSDDLW